jgi:hypothetical protein
MLIIYVNCALGSLFPLNTSSEGLLTIEQSASKGISSGGAQETNRNMQIAAKGEP